MPGSIFLAWAVTAAIAALSCANSPGQRAPDPGSVVIRNLSQPGAFEIENSGPDTELAWAATVQRQQNGAWTDEVTDITLVERCGQTPAGSCVRLPRGARLRPVPWNGLTCGSQCAASCRANVYLGPGRFRLVLSDCDAKRKFYGPAFDLPPYEKRAASGITNSPAMAR
jgi:hypothetical protein